MFRLSMMAVALLFGVGSVTKADVSGLNFSVTTYSLSTSMSDVGSMAFSKNAFTYTPSSGDAESGYYLETVDQATGESTISILFMNGSTQDIGYAGTIPLILSTFELVIIYGVTVDADGISFFGGYAMTLIGLPSLPGLPFSFP